MTTRIPTRTYFCDVERPGRPRKPARLDEKAEVGDYYDHVFRWLGDIDERGILVPSLEEIYIEASSETTNKLLSIFVLAFAFGPMDLTPLSRCTDAELCGLLPRPVRSLYDTSPRGLLVTRVTRIFLLDCNLCAAVGPALWDPFSAA
ncbi:hypothetical protein EYZ11_006678 [Aspergillus tanneri]|uniref:Uncharacterized protein n=1 Tax=Aspergillus tanneri TaxID=1220188 RepID=A0A4S3JET1_9EURO|nr:hypothetical protein EYZ11_006678 [Aspergillus tanneri]